MSALLGGAALASGTSGCTPASPSARTPRAAWSGRLDRRAADELLASLDKRLSWIDEQTLPDDIAPLSKLSKMEDKAEELERKTALTRKAMRALYLTGRFADLPDEMKAHPGVQARVAAIQPDMDDAVLGMTSVLEGMTDADHRRVQNYLRANPGIGERVARYLERPAVEDAVPFRRRVGMRTQVLELTQRMAAQSPALVTDPLVRKVRRMEARPATEQSRLIAARMGEQAFWEHQEKLASIYEAWHDELGAEGVMIATAIGAPQPGGAVPAPPTSERAVSAQNAPAPRASPPPQSGSAEQHSSRKESTIRTGGIIMGFGAGSVLLGLLFWGLSSAGAGEAFSSLALVFGVTVGPILLITGLTVLIVGAAMSAD